MVSGKEQSGTALIIVLFAVATIMVIALSLSEQMQRSIQYSASASVHRQISWHLNAAESLAVKRLSAGLSAEAVTRFFEIDNGYIRTTVKDMRSCFNLNSIAEQISERGGKGINSRPAMQLEWLLTDAGLSSAEANLFLTRLYDWFDPDGLSVDQGGREDELYLNVSVPHRSANGVMSHISELSYLDLAVDTEQKLPGSLCLLPFGAGQKVNLNTLESPGLMVAVAPEVSQALAEKLIKGRPEGGYESMSEVLELLTDDERTVFSEHLQYFVLNSQYYRIDTQVVWHGIQRRRVSQIALHNGGYIYQREDRSWM